MPYGNVTFIECSLDLWVLMGVDVVVPGRVVGSCLVLPWVLTRSLGGEVPID